MNNCNKRKIIITYSEMDIDDFAAPDLESLIFYPLYANLDNALRNSSQSLSKFNNIIVLV